MKLFTELILINSSEILSIGKRKMAKRWDYKVISFSLSFDDSIALSLSHKVLGFGNFADKFIDIIGNTLSYGRIDNYNGKAMYRCRATGMKLFVDDA